MVLAVLLVLRFFFRFDLASFICTITRHALAFFFFFSSSIWFESNDSCFCCLIDPRKSQQREMKINQDASREEVFGVRGLRLDITRALKPK